MSASSGGSAKSRSIVADLEVTSTVAPDQPIAIWYPDAVSQTRDKEQWAIALYVEKHHGADGPRSIAEKIGKLALEGDAEGIEMWKAVAARYEKLQRP